MIRTLIIFILTLSIADSMLASENEKYIERELIKIDKLLLDNKFERGTIYFQNDSLETDLMVFKKREKINTYLFCIAKLDNDSIKVFTAKDILGYRLLNELFIKYNSSGEDIFIKKTIAGKIDLYEKIELPSDNKLLFYVKIPSFEHFFVINPSENNITETTYAGRTSNSPDRTYYSSKGIHQKFKEFISIYFRDCEKLKYMVDSEFYTINNIPSIVETYNNCF